MVFSRDENDPDLSSNLVLEDPLEDRTSGPLWVLARTQEDRAYKSFIFHLVERISFS